jgi:hypothetical protein
MDERVRRAAEDAGYAAAYGLAADTRLGSYGIPRADVYRGDGRARFRIKTSRLLPYARAVTRLVD